MNDSVPCRTAFRFDASPTIGLGHLVRALNFSASVAEPVFVVNSQAAPELAARGVPNHQIVIAHSSWWQELPDLDWVVVDLNYSGGGCNASLEVAGLTAKGFQVAVFDSLPPDHFVPLESSTTPDIIATPYTSAHKLRPPPKGSEWLAGPEYAVFSDDFIRAREAQTGSCGDRILVTCGGSDPSQLTERILKSCESIAVGIDVVIGPMFSPVAEARILAQAKEMAHVVTYKSPRSLLELILRAGVVVGRPGLTRYEVAMLGRNALYLVEGSSFRSYFEGFARTGLGRMYFASDSGGQNTFLDQLAALSDEDFRLKVMSPNETALQKIDGFGKSRILERMKALRCQRSA